MQPVRLCLVAVALWLVQMSAFAATVGFARLVVPDGRNPPIEIGIWYPAALPSRPTPIGLFVQDLAPDAPVAGEHLPLVVLSHGNGGEFTGHGDTAFALAAAGFAAVALTHTGDNTRDQSRALDLPDRVRQLSVVITYMVSAWPAHAIDASRIGAFGFSTGGFTVLAAAGGDPALSRIGPHCAAHPDFYDCQLMKRHEHQVGEHQVGGPVEWHFTHDARIRAISVAAPALGFAFTPEGLRAVAIPVQLWRAADDRILPQPFYAEAVRAALPRPPEMHVVARAGHFDFLAPCSEALARVVPAICLSESGFDRTAFHRRFDADIVTFFERALRAAPATPRSG